MNIFNNALDINKDQVHNPKASENSFPGLPHYLETTVLTVFPIRHEITV
jgi:hypothetical protein